MDANAITNTITVLDELVKSLKEFMITQKQLDDILDKNQTVIHLDELDNVPRIHFSIGVDADVKCPDDALLTYLNNISMEHMWCKPNETAHIKNMVIENDRIEIAVEGFGGTDSVRLDRITIYDLLVLAVIEEQTKIFEQILELTKSETELRRKALEELKELVSVVKLVAGDEK